uniref:PUA domain-containing protein n=1 Tax=Oncorhynchus mykiss TaxID=8022 RepID=A0A8C7TIY0_ONCMY
MENCSSSDKEKDRSTQLSDCCISVRPQLFLMCRPLYSSTPTSKGAIKFVLSGANIMCPGLTSPGAKLYPSASETVVAIMVEGKQYALGVGVMKMSAENIFKFTIRFRHRPRVHPPSIVFQKADNILKKFYNCTIELHHLDWLHHRLK